MLWLVYRQVISLGEFFTLLFYSFLIFNPLYELPAFATSLQETKASNTTLQAIHAMQPEPDLSDAPTLDHIERIEFAQVDFSYSDEHPALQDISFTVKAGQTIAFVGPSGAGKSTILKLLSGLYHPTSGKIYFNQLLSHELNRPSLKQHFGIVAQDTQLFSGSVRDNLLFVQPDATDRDCL
jgi:ATP-binding cassette subfamily B protein